MKRSTTSLAVCALLLAGAVQAQAQPQARLQGPASQQQAAASRAAADPAPGDFARRAAERRAEPASVKGITRCNSDLSLGFPLTGRIGQVSVEEGSVVKRGQPMIALENAAEALEVERRRVQWKSNAELDAAQARLETASVQARAARQVYASTKGISQEELQNRELARELAFNDVARLKANKEVERLDYLLTRENLERRTLRAPVPGIVTRLLRQRGESVQANEPALRLCDLSKILFVANVPSAQVEHLKANDPVNLVMAADNAPLRGKVLFVSPVVDAASGLREVKVELLAGSAPVRAGMTALLLLAPAGR